MQNDYVELTAELNTKLADLRKEAAETMKGFSQMAKSVHADGALSQKQKELIAMAIGIANRCSGLLGLSCQSLGIIGCNPRRIHRNAGNCHVYGRRSVSNDCRRSLAGI